MRLVIVFDNYALQPGTQAGWGYACYLPEKRLLFDTGSESASLLHNLRLLSFDPREIRVVMLSHFHWDHAGGLLGLLQEAGPKQVVLHRGFSPRFASEATRLGGQVLFFDQPGEILPGVFSTGIIKGPVLEAGLVVRHEENSVLITGCAHPGILKMVSEVKKRFGPLQMIMGGFHLGGASRKRVFEIAEGLKKLGIQRVAPSHCTGDKALAIFAEVFGKGFLRAGVGFVFNL